MKVLRSGNLSFEEHLDDLDLHQITEILDKLEIFTFMSTNAACHVTCENPTKAHLVGSQEKTLRAG